MRRSPVHVRAHDVRLYLVHLDLRGLFPMADRTQHREQFPCALHVLQHGEGHRGPDRGVCVLTAVLPDAGNVALDIPGLESRLVKRRLQQLDKTMVTVDQELVHRGHSLARPVRISEGRQYRPALADRIDAALVVDG